MRFFTLLAVSALASLTAMGSAPVKRAPRKSDVKQIRAFVNTPIMRAPEVNEEVIWEAPEGEETVLSRSCDGFITEAFDATHSRILGSAVKMVNGDDGYVYLNHIASEYPVDTWVKATREGDMLTINGVNAIYKEYDYDNDEEVNIYLVPMQVQINEYNVGTFVACDDMKFEFKVAADGTLTAVDPEKLLGVCVRSANPDATGNDVWVWAGFGDRDITMSPVTAEVVTPPADAKIQDWVMTDQYVSNFVGVAIVGNDFYVQGLDVYLPEAWVKGEIKGDKVVFPSGQYLGIDYEIFYLSYFCGAEFTMVDDKLNASIAPEAVFSYNAEKNSMKTDNGYIINSTADTIFPLYAFTSVTVAVQDRNPEAAPEAPYDLDVSMDEYTDALRLWFQIPNIDVDGNLLNEKKLFYQILLDNEPVNFTLLDEQTLEEYNSTLVPYNYNDWMDFWTEGADHTVYVYDDFYEKLAVRSVYINENDKEIYSADCVYSLSKVNDINTVKAVSTAYYDLLGRRIERPVKGIVLRTVTYSDGTKATQKAAF